MLNLPDAYHRRLLLLTLLQSNFFLEILWLDRGTYSLYNLTGRQISASCNLIEVQLTFRHSSRPNAFSHTVEMGHIFTSRHQVQQDKRQYRWNADHSWTWPIGAIIVLCLV